jgi:hypothetical protein
MNLLQKTIVRLSQLKVIHWLLTIVFIDIIGYFPNFVERVYAQNIYPIIAIVNRWFFQFFPFSAGDIIYIFGFTYLVFLIFQVFRNIKTPMLYLTQLSTYLLQIVWVFYLSWGFNYFREPLAKQLNISETKYTMTQLQDITDKMIDKSNSLQLQLAQNDSLAVEIPYGIERIIKKAEEGYVQIENIIGQKYTVPCEKSSLLSKPISYMGVSGYLNPFSGEAQINKIYPKIFLPSIASHEIAHQLGYAPEDEANFLGYLSASHNSDPYFRYSAYIDALYYCLIEMRKADKDMYKIYIKKVNKGILKNYSEAFQFSKTHQFPIDFSSTYDAYLKMNKQKSGIKSYSEMLSLLIAYEGEGKGTRKKERGERSEVKG